MSEQRLYGIPGAEQMYFDPGGAYESDIEPWDKPESGRAVIEEWSVHPPGHHLPSAARIAEWVAEWTGEQGEIDEGCYDSLMNAAARPDVVAAAEELRRVLASHVTYRMADKCLADHVVTWDDNDEPLLDGKPLYVRSEAS